MHMKTHQSLNTLQRADKGSTLGIYFLGSGVKQSPQTPSELSAQQRGNKDRNLEMLSRIKNTPAEKVTEILQSRIGDLKPEPNTSWKPPTALSGLSVRVPSACSLRGPPSTPETLLFPRDHARAVILNTLQSGTGFCLLAKDCQIPD